MAISAQEVNKLRQMTGAGMMDCKKALTEANGDFDAAVDILRKKGQKVAAKRAGKEASEGSVFIRTINDGKEGVIIALSCETDFVAKNEEFQNLGYKIVDVAASENPSSKEELLSLKIDGNTVEQLITDLIGKIGEKVEVSAYERIKGDKVIEYVHAGSKLGVLVALQNANGSNVTDIGKDVAMQIAAMNPVAVDKDQVDEQIVQREIEIGKEQAKQEGKPDDLLEKIAMGKLNKFYKEATLLNQQFVKDTSKTIKQVLNETHEGLTVSEFKRVSVG